MSVPLLLERSSPGSGPQVPIKDEYDILVVEGLAVGCQVHVDIGTARISVQVDCKMELPHKTVRNLVAQARLEGKGSKVHVWLEKSNGR